MAIVRYVIKTPDGGILFNVLEITEAAAMAKAEEEVAQSGISLSDCRAVPVALVELELE